MSGKPINAQQVKVYMETRNSGKSQVTSAAKAGIAESSGRRIEKGKINPGNKKKRYWRTRKDPFEQVWASEIVPQLEECPLLTPITLFENLQQKYPGQYPDRQLRTFQRRVSQWKSLSGPDKEVMFRQEQQVGRMGISDFTTLKKFEVTIAGVPFKHLLYHYRLAYSGWCSVTIVHGGESYAALAEGLQNALWRLGGSPKEHRSDSLSAAYKNLEKAAVEDMTSRYEALCSHYNMVPTRNNKGKGHENGSIESPHGHLKQRMHQALLLRGSFDFESVSSYQEWLNHLVKGINERNRDQIEFERQVLQPLPLHRTADYTEHVVRVSTSSTIILKRALYTVPSRLVGDTLRVHLYDNRLEINLGATHTATLPRVYPTDNNHRARQVDYRHVIKSLEKKPQAFRYSQLRDDLLPNDQYKAIWSWFEKELDPRKACKMIVGVLSLASRADCEQELGNHLEQMMEKSQLPNLHELQVKYDKKIFLVPEISIKQPSTDRYNELLSSLSKEVQ